MANPIVRLKGIPTLTKLYAQGALPKPATTPGARPSAELNDLVSIWLGDITTLGIGAITNAANPKLLHGGGICGAIFEAAGASKLKAECKTLGTVKPGDATITNGYDLPARYIVHAVGPDCRVADQNRRRDHLLQKTYENALQRACDKGVREIALCGLSTGIYEFPIVEGTRIAIRTVRQFLERNPNHFDRVIFCVFNGNQLSLYCNEIINIFPPTGNEKQQLLARKGLAGPAGPAKPQQPTVRVDEDEAPEGKRAKGRNEKETSIQGKTIDNDTDKGRQEQARIKKTSIQGKTIDDDTDKGQQERARIKRTGKPKPQKITEREDSGSRSTGERHPINVGATQSHKEAVAHGVPSGQNEPPDPDYDEWDEARLDKMLGEDKDNPVLRIRTWAGNDYVGREQDRMRLHRTGMINKFPRISRPGKRVDM